jgi:hypothetical protein
MKRDVNSRNDGSGVTFTRPYKERNCEISDIQLHSVNITEKCLSRIRQVDGH